MALNAIIITTILSMLISIAFADLDLTKYDPNPPIQINIETPIGQLNCSVPPDRPVQSPPIAGINVIYQCGTVRATVADILWNGPKGVIIFVIKNVGTTLFNQMQQCRLVIRLPFARCAFHPTEGTLEAVMEGPITTVFDHLLGGKVCNIRASEFHYYPPSPPPPSPY